MKALSTTLEYGLRFPAWPVQLQGQPQKERAIIEGAHPTHGWFVEIIQALANADILSTNCGSNVGFTLDSNPADQFVLEISNAIDQIEFVTHSFGVTSHDKCLCLLHEHIDGTLADTETSFNANHYRGSAHHIDGCTITSEDPERKTTPITKRLNDMMSRDAAIIFPSRIRSTPMATRFAVGPVPDRVAPAHAHRRFRWLTCLMPHPHKSHPTRANTQKKPVIVAAHRSDGNPVAVWRVAIEGVPSRLKRPTTRPTSRFSACLFRVSVRLMRRSTATGKTRPTGPTSLLTSPGSLTPSVSNPAITVPNGRTMSGLNSSVSRCCY